MKRVFLDTNVILDAALPVRANFVCANSILSACDNNDIQGCVSLLTVANTAYILKKGRTEKEIVLQYECAKAAGCELIVTSNIKHFKFCKDIEVVSTIDYAQQFIEDENN